MKHNSIHFLPLMAALFGLTWQAAACAHAQESIRVACVGDSITAGARVDATTESYPARLQQLLGRQYQVRNFGTGGATLLKTGRPNVWQKLDAVKKFQPHIVVISLGTNDTVGGNRRNWEKIDRFDADYVDLIDSLAELATKPRIVLCTPTSMVLETKGLSNDRLANLTERKPRLQELCQRIRKLAKEQGGKNVSLLELNGVLNNHPELLSQGDGVHPNREGYLAIAQAVASNLRHQHQTKPEDHATAAEKPNVLLIAIDDLNDWVGCLAGHPQASTPHIDALAKRGTLFSNAHCQAPICNPSRTSALLGLRPSTTGIYLNRPWFRTTRRNRQRVTLPQYFRQQGYETLTAGKIYHGSRVDEASFEIVGPRPGQRLKIDERLLQFKDARSGLWDYGPQQYSEDKFGDFVDASWAIEQLEADHDAPFMLAVGLYRPHVPWYAPQRFFDARPLAGVQLPKVRDDDRDDLPPAAIDLTDNPTPPSHDWFVGNQQWHAAVQAYLASTSFTDDQVGRIIAALDKSPHVSNTIVILFSDHGFHLGEKQRWAKQSLWERSTRVPFIVCLPGQRGGQRCSQPVELLSIYPTLLELCGLPARDELEGVSIRPLLTNPAAAWEHPAITTYQANNHAVRSEHFRYIRYADGSEELYDHREDPREWNNLAGESRYAEVLAAHAKWLPQTNVPDAGKK